MTAARILGLHVDTLEVQLTGRLTERARSALRAAHDALRTGEEPEPIVTDSEVYAWRRAARDGYLVELVGPQGSRYLFAAADSHRPCCTIVYSPIDCWTLGPDGLVEHTHAAAEGWLGRYSADVGRLDIACDVAAWEPSQDRASWLTRARRAQEISSSDVARATRDDVEAGAAAELGEPLLPALSDAGAVTYERRHTDGLAFSGWSFGLGAAMCRIYDKELEAAVRPRKAWILDAYASPRGPWYWQRGEESLWRTEYQLRTPMLRELGADGDRSLDRVCTADALGRVWQYTTRAWLREIVPDSSERRERCRSTETWQKIQAALGTHPATRRPPPTRTAEAEALLRQALGTLAAAYRATHATPVHRAHFLQWATQRIGELATTPWAQKRLAQPAP